MNGVFEKIIKFIHSEINRTESWAEHDTLINVEFFVEELKDKYNNGWIPCYDRLPANNEIVIFSTKDGFVECGFYDEKNVWCVNEGYFPNAFKFIAWQPLPKPYKEGGIENE